MRERVKFLIGILALTAPVFPERAAQAQSVANLMTQPTDAVSQQAFALNPALPLVPGMWTVAGAVEPQRKTTSLDPDGLPQTSATRTRTVLGVARSAAITGDLLMTLSAEASFIASDGKKLDYRSRYLGLRFATEMAHGLKAGLLLHGSDYRVAKLEFADGVASDTSGYVLGFGVGILWGEKGRRSVGLVYLPTMRGTAEAEGEHRILVRAGTAGADVTLPLGDTMTLGAGGKVSMQEQEAGADADPGASEPGALGTPDLALSAGVDQRFGAQAFGRGCAVSEFYKHGLVASATRLKVIVGTITAGVESALGFSMRYGAPMTDVTVYGEISFKI